MKATIVVDDDERVDVDDEDEEARDDADDAKVNGHASPPLPLSTADGDFLSSSMHEDSHSHSRGNTHSDVSNATIDSNSCASPVSPNRVRDDRESVSPSLSPHHDDHEGEHHHSFTRHALTSSAINEVSRRFSSSIHHQVNSIHTSVSNGLTVTQSAPVNSGASGASASSNQLSPEAAAAAAAAAAASFIVNPSFASLASWPSTMTPSQSSNHHHHHHHHISNHVSHVLQSPTSFLTWMRANASVNAHVNHGGSLSPSNLSKLSSLHLYLLFLLCTVNGVPHTLSFLFTCDGVCV